MAVASSALSSSSEGLQALLRDHPELVSSQLSRAAGPGYNEVTESTRGSRGPSTPGTPSEEVIVDEMAEAPSIGEGRPNLGSAGEYRCWSCQVFPVSLVRHMIQLAAKRVFLHLWLC